MKVFITGASGWTAAPLLQVLHQAGHSITGFDLAPAAEGAARWIKKHFIGDVSDYNQVLQAIQATAPESIIHLAVAVGQNDYLEPEIPFAVNVLGTYHVFEAARRAGVQKVVLISSAAVHLPRFELGIREAETGWTSSPGKDHLYDLTKRLQETIARDFSATFDIQALVLRAGHVVDGHRETDSKDRVLADLDYCRGGWVCRHDLAQACLLALAYEPPGYSAFHIIGAEPARNHYDVHRTEEVLGLTFESRFENYPP